MEREQLRATMSAILLALVVLPAAGYGAVGEYNLEVMITVAIALPMMLAGIYLGRRRVSPRCRRIRATGAITGWRG
jgi:hypothetical protein